MAVPIKHNSRPPPPVAAVRSSIELNEHLGVARATIVTMDDISELLEAYRTLCQ